MLEDLANMCIGKVAIKEDNTELALHSIQSKAELPDAQAGFKMEFSPYRRVEGRPTFDTFKIDLTTVNIQKDNDAPQIHDDENDEDVAR
jgi:hypothetical protein